MLSIKDLKVQFRDGRRAIKAIDGVSFDIGADEVVGLVGESGSGKTMTALSIMGLLPQNGRAVEGKILFGEDDILRLKESRILKIRGSKIAMIFQEPFTSLNPVLRVGEQIIEAMRAHKRIGVRWARKEAVILLRKVKIDEPHRILNSYPHQLSGGQRQRIMIAMALSCGPQLLIADEPTTALDVTIQSDILNLLLELKREYKMSILFITHDLEVVNQIADRILVMKEGKIVESGITKDVLSSPQVTYTKDLIAAIPQIDKDKAPYVGEIAFMRVNFLAKNFPIERGILRKKVGELRAVYNVKFDIFRGETLGLVGESGSGKTTLAKMIMNLIKPDSGNVIVEAKTTEQLLKEKPKEIRRMMQIVFQDPYSSLDPRMRMKDIILEGPILMRVKRRERTELLKDILKNVVLKYVDRFKYPHQFSGGEKQRIAIARALAVKPQFLVLDEPVSSLDVSIQSKILKLLKDLQRELGLTYLLISHDLKAVGSIADEIAVMYKGQIVERAPTDLLYKDPHHKYSKRLIGALPKL